MPGAILGMDPRRETSAAGVSRNSRGQERERSCARKDERKINGHQQVVGITSSSYLLFLHFSMRALVTTKGQVTIPKELREKFGIKPGSEVDFVAGSDGISVAQSGRFEASGSLSWIV